MATARPLAPFAAVCVIFAMLVLAGLSDGTHSPTAAPAPSPHISPSGGTTHSSATAGFPPHLFVSTLFASFCISLFY
ncbi:hypothetical protein CsSME_00004948 [Camellia sinensis var. sinensis]